MKFIRDIIGEKRQADPSIAAARAAEGQVEDERNTGMSAQSEDIAAPGMDEKKFDEREPQSEKEQQSPRQKSYEPTLGVSEDVARFFAETDEINLFENEYDDIEPGARELRKPGAEAATEPKTLDEAAPTARSIALESLARASAKGAIEEIDEETLDETDEETLDADDCDEADEQAFEEAEDSSETAMGTEEPLGEPDAAVAAAVDLSIRADQEPVSDDVSQEQETANEPEVAATPQPAMSAFPPRPAQPAAMDTATNPAPQAMSAPAPEAPDRVEVPQPAVGRGASRHGRVKTRLLGFNAGMETEADPMADNAKAGAAPYTSFPVGWLIVVEGPGRGSAFTLFHGVSTIGRGEDQTVRLDFGDNSISRESHASVAYDDRQKGFFIGHGGKANIVRRNDRPVLSTEELAAGDTITIGETTLRFVPFCSPEFSWEQETAMDRTYAKQA